MGPELKAAAQALRLGRAGDAKMLAALWLKQNPGDPLALTILAAAAIDLRRPVEAEQILRDVAERAPHFLQARMHLARSLQAQSRVAEAIAIVEQAFTHEPQSLQANSFLAHLQAELGRYEDAAATYNRLLASNENDANLWVGSGDMLRFAGDRGGSEAAYRRALALDPRNGMAWWGLSGLDAKAISDADLQQLEAATDGALLHFALARALDQRKRPDEAFDHFRKANELWREAHPYDPAELGGEVNRSIALFTPDFFESRSGFGAPDSGPIFIVGMPRSGSTLLERMLGRHSHIEATGELPVLPRMVDMLSAQHAYPDLVADLDADRARDLGETYLVRAGEFRKTAKPLFTDKLHMNWRHLGLIRLILPGAKIIDMRRDPLDCCWSNYKLHFTRGHLASNDLADIGRFYSDYVRMMDHLGGAVLQVRYEELVDDPEQQIRRVIDFLGLPFEEQCLDFHLATEPVGTASSEQVRKPLNREGIGAWKPYEPWLAPLINSLGPLT
jgi:tetratricopeptide (TPR) repeat protein